MSDVGFSRAGIAAAVAVPLVAIGGLALLSPLALGRKRRDLDSVEGNDKSMIASYARKNCLIFVLIGQRANANQMPLIVSVPALVAFTPTSSHLTSASSDWSANWAAPPRTSTTRTQFSGTS